MIKDNIGSNKPLVNGEGVNKGSIGTRLKEERERLGFNQTEFGSYGGVGKKAQGNYEADERSPNTDYLKGIAKIGVDIQYVILGIHTEPYLIGEDVGKYELIMDDNLMGFIVADISHRLKNEGLNLSPYELGANSLRIYDIARRFNLDFEGQKRCAIDHIKTLINGIKAGQECVNGFNRK